ncbi:YCF48-related protein [Pseudomonas sp. TNT2022 ID681]|uniref:YCF48-related protein n=2 Tax=Pseudomonas fontis TaxID=2942633 RepID=A0ABT5NVK2_9PSED|nr:YCF48-related protein [Pseudomonas fontis]MDD0975240.1 YCF48-related protein [Pseudomonas fontis]MDD0992210.1 YCF48-related protein [Pseudomonas fontis]
MGLFANTVEAAKNDDAAKTIYSQTSDKASRSLLIDVVHAGPRLVAVGDRGHILFSDDQGSTWTQARVPSRSLLTAVKFVDDKHGWAVGHDAQILSTDDGGATWNKQFEDLTREAPLLDVWFENTQHGIAIGAYGAALETTDGGKHWQDIGDRLDNQDGYHLNGIAAVKDAGLFIVGEQGSMFRSSDNGQTWETVQGPYEGTLFGVIGTSQANTLLAYGLRGNLYRSTDFGTSWDKIALQGVRGPLEFGLYGATLLDDGSLVLVGNGGTVLRSSDDGVSFAVVNRADRLALSAVSGLADGNLIVVGQGGEHAATATGAERAQP